MDYETADENFHIGRFYRSFQVGRPIDGKVLPRALPRGLTGGWNFDFGYEIQLGAFSGSPSSPDAEVAVLAPDGSGFGFVLQPTGEWIPDPAFGAANAPNDLKLEFVGTLPSDLADIAASSSTWILTDGQDNVWTFQTRVGPNGGSYVTAWPTEKVARDGYTWTFAYNSDSSLASITDSFGRAASFSWYQYFITTLAPPPSGSLPYPLAIAAITLPDGTSLRYTYDPPPATSAPSTTMIKRLAKVERVSGTNTILDSTAYLYEDTRFPTHVTGVIDNRGIRIRTYAYDAQGRSTTTQEADGTNAEAVEFGTNGTALTRRVTNALGKAETYTYSSFSAGPADYRLTGIAGEASANTPASTTAVSYGTDTFVSSQTDAEGRVTTTVSDSRGRPTSVTEGTGTADERTTTTTWNTSFNVPDSIVRPGVTETRAYNTSGQLTSVTLTDTTTRSTPYSTNGQTRTTTYNWDSNGRLLSINGPLAADGMGNDDLTTFAYDTSGNLETQTDALGHVTTYGDYDANGRPGTMTDPNDIVTDYIYDPLGRIETITVEHPGNPALNATTTIGYDEVGNVTEITLPSTDTLIMDYDDADQLVSVRAASGERRDYTHDAMNNVTGMTVKRSNGSLAGRTMSSFDELGRLIHNTVGTGHTSSLAYDKVDNITSSTTPNGNATTTAFDALNRVVSTVAPDSGNTALAYDASDNLTAYTDPISVSTQYVYDGFGDVIQETSPDRGTSTYWYDAAGELIESSDGRGQVIDYSRDYLGRVTEMVPQGRPSSETVDFSWDSGGLSGSSEVGRLAKVADGSGTTEFKYDHMGNVLVKQQTIGTTSAAQLAYTYDIAGRTTQITYPSGRLVKYDYDSKGRVTAVSTKASVGDPTWTVVANDFGYEPFGPVASMALGNGLAVEKTRGTDGLLASSRLYRVADGTNLSYLSYGYDADGNIGSITDNLDDTNSVLYGYDSVDRLSLTVAGTAGIATSYSYTSGTNQLALVTDAEGTRTIAYDDHGNTLSETRPGAITLSTAYDGYGRLTEYNLTDLGTADFVYNGLDDRVTMSLPTAGTRHFIYDLSGRVMGEYGASASEVKAEFIWLQPRAANDNEPFGGGDGLNGYAPLAIATPDSSGIVRIAWVYSDHLGVPLVTTDIAGDPKTTPNDYLVPGFPGQSRLFSDLYYNRYRDYDATTGRYIQADPVGLKGGSNAYLYAGGNPINLTDPMGLFFAPGAEGGAEIGCAIDIETGCIPGAIIGGILGIVGGLIVPSSAPVPQKPPIPDVCPKDLCEQLALAEAKAGAGVTIMRNLGDEPRLVAHYGRGPWVKRQHTHICPDGRKLIIHYFSNGRGLNVELKFV